MGRPWINNKSMKFVNAKSGSRTLLINLANVTYVEINSNGSLNIHLVDMTSSATLGHTSIHVEKGDADSFLAQLSRST